MAAKFLASLACVITATSAIAVPTGPLPKYAVPALPVAKYAVPTLSIAKYINPALPVAKLAYAEAEAPAHYSFEYSVEDKHSGDVKQQKESRHGDAVQGFYSLVQPNGVQRIVEYTADKVHGFNAIVRYEGHPTQAPVAKFAYAPAPVAKVAYAPASVAQLSFSHAPVAPLSYSHAPVAPLSYSHAPAALAYAPAPVAKVAPGLAHAAPAKIAYTQNLGHVSFATPSFSYQH